MKHTTELLRFSLSRWKRWSSNGNPYWCFEAYTVDWDRRVLKTARNSSFAYSQKIEQLHSGVIVLVRYHETSKGNLIADQWEIGTVGGVDLKAAFSAQVEAAQIAVETIRGRASSGSGPVRL